MYVENVKAFGEVVEALRVRNYIPKEAKAQKCEDCKKDILAFGNMKADQVAAYTKQKYNKSLCTDCGKKYSVETEKKDVNEWELFFGWDGKKVYEQLAVKEFHVMWG